MSPNFSDANSSRVAPAPDKNTIHIPVKGPKSFSKRVLSSLSSSVAPSKIFTTPLKI